MVRRESFGSHFVLGSVQVRCQGGYCVYTVVVRCELTQVHVYQPVHNEKLFGSIIRISFFRQRYLVGDSILS